MHVVMRHVLLPAVVVSAIVLAACPKGDASTSPTSGAASADVFAKVQQQLGARLQAIHDFDLTATMVAADGETLRYRCDRRHIVRCVGTEPGTAMMVCILKAAVME